MVVFAFCVFGGWKKQGYRAHGHGEVATLARSLAPLMAAPTSRTRRTAPRPPGCVRGTGPRSAGPRGGWRSACRQAGEGEGGSGGACVLGNTRNGKRTSCMRSVCVCACVCVCVRCVCARAYCVHVYAGGAWRVANSGCHLPFPPPPSPLLLFLLPPLPLCAHPPVVQVVRQLVEFAQPPLGQPAPAPAAQAGGVVVEALGVAHEEVGQQEHGQEGRQHQVGGGHNAKACVRVCVGLQRWLIRKKVQEGEAEVGGEERGEGQGRGERDG